MKSSKDIADKIARLLEQEFPALTNEDLLVMLEAVVLLERIFQLSLIERDQPVPKINVDLR